MSDNDAKNKETELLFRIVRERYGSYLSAEELSEVREGLDSLVEAAESLREVRLENNDEPFSVFLPYRSED